MDITSYLIVVSASLGIAYFLYRMFYPNTNFRQQRFFLLGSIVISLFLPLSHVSIEIGGRKGGITGFSLPSDIMQSSNGQPFIAEKSLFRNIADYLPYIYNSINWLSCDSRYSDIKDPSSICFFKKDDFPRD